MALYRAAVDPDALPARVRDLLVEGPRAARIVGLGPGVTKITGENLTGAVITALEERLERLTGLRRGPDLRRTLEEIANRCRALPDLDSRSANEILGYDDAGTFET